MNTFTFKRIALTASFAVLIGHSAQADTFTAIASGNFSSSSTWLSGTVPPSLLLTDNIQVPAGITVTLDKDVRLNGALSAIIIDGTVISSANSANSLVFTAGTLTGHGSISVDSVVLGMASGFSFGGSINAKTLVSLGNLITTASAISISSALELQSGVLGLYGGSLSMGNGATIIVAGGTMTRGGSGTFLLTNDYHVIYRSISATTGIELAGMGLKNIEIDVPSLATVSLGNNLNVNGTLKLSSGTLNTNGKDLNFGNTADFSADGNGNIASTNGTNMSFSSSSDLTGGLRFSNTGNMVNNLTVNMANSSASIKLASDLHVNGILSLQAGRIDIGSNDLVADGSVSGGSASSFIITGEQGRLLMSLGAGGLNIYHIGTSSNYAPAVVQGNAGTAASKIGVGVNPSVFAEGYTNSGVDLSQTQAVVNATWFVTSTATTNLDLNLQTMWSANMEVNSFDRANLYMSHYANGNWDAPVATTATTEANGMFSVRRDNITSLSPFAVIGKDAVTTSVANTAIVRNGLSVYPNPAVHTLNIPGNYTHAKIYNLNGTLVKTAMIDRNAVSVGELPTGLYTLYVNGSNNTATTNFIKQ